MVREGGVEGVRRRGVVPLGPFSSLLGALEAAATAGGEGEEGHESGANGCDHDHCAVVEKETVPQA